MRIFCGKMKVYQNLVVSVSTDVYLLISEPQIHAFYNTAII